MLIEKTEENGLYDIDAVIADTAYCTKENIETCDGKDIKLVAPLHHVEKCKQCPLKDGCYKEGAKHKTYSIRIISEEHLKQKEFQMTPEFKRDIRIRNRIEGKNSELKNRHGMRTTISFGLNSMEIQTAVALFYVNLKRIMKLMS